jgi:hypothetical protein
VSPDGWPASDWRLPMLAWLLSFANWSERRRVVVVLVAAVGYLVVAVVVAVANAIGIELAQASPPMIALFIPGVVLLLGTGLAAVITPRRIRGARWRRSPERSPLG